MPTISVLPKDIAELIAAGEVVEKPVSVIKELVENAIDAGATDITVEIRRGGILYMRVTDNGCGIKPSDVKTAFLRHATSKIVDKYDLDSIATLGFRGEALAAISAVSKVELITRTADSDIGTRYCIEGGIGGEVEEYGSPEGTTIIVRDLFYNTPARMKFLRKDVAEGNLISDMIEKIALSHPEVSFKLIRDGKVTVSSSGDGKLSSVIYSVLGREFASGLIPVNETLGGITVKGYVCKPIYSRPKRNAQYFFLNGRFVRSATGVAALEAAYKNSVMVGKFPSCVLHLEVPLETVDVNVHPAKTEVRFCNEKAVFDAVFFGVKNALQKGDERPNITAKKPMKFSAFEHMTSEQYRQAVIKTDEAKQENKQINVTALDKNEDTQIKNKPTDRIVFKDYIPARESKKVDIPVETITESKIEKPVATDIIDNKETVYTKEAFASLEELKRQTVKSTEVVSTKIQTEEDDDIKYIGEAFLTYIIVQKGTSLFLIDKHAAHERILFEELKKREVPQSQGLLVPVSVKLDAKDYNAVLENLPLIEKSGFTIEDFGNGSVIVRAVPASLTSEDVKDTVFELAASLKETASVNISRLDDIYHTVACKAAIKGGNITSAKELTLLAKRVLSNKDILYCPHGRPVAFEIKKTDLEKQFGRIQ